MLSAQLAPRHAREKLFHETAGDAGIVVGANGRCERDAIKLVSKLYSNFSKAMRTDFSDTRPAQSFLLEHDTKIRGARYFFLDWILKDYQPIRLNSATHVLCSVLKLVAASVAEAELGSLF